MTKTQSDLLNEIRDTLSMWKEDLKNVPENCNYWWVPLAQKNQVEIMGNTKSLQVLEREGFIKILDHRTICYGKNVDLVEVL